jgi:septum formation protein
MHDIRRLVLASQSPRRSELLRQAGFEFTISPLQISEIPDENLNLQDQIRGLAREKALACINSGKVPKGRGNLVLSADTVVVLDGQILGKPENRLENAQYLRRLSARVHSVITGVCLLDVDSGLEAIGHDESTIEFRALTTGEIDAYCATDDGLDKAGGYGIQGAAGAFVARTIGAVDNIVGLPVALVEKLLSENGWNVERHRK